MSAVSALRQTAPEMVEGEFAFTDRDFARIATLLREETGIYLPEAKATLVYSRLAKRLRVIGLKDFAAYCALVDSPEGEQERMAMFARHGGLTKGDHQIEGINNRQAGGMARVRALRAEIEKTAPDLLFLHAGDFLSPSFPGRIFAGAQMLDVMNLMDGNPAYGSFDARMFAAFGNHEFDDTNCNKDGPLAKLVSDSEFTWLASNLVFSKCGPLSKLAGNPNIAANKIVESGGLKIGLFSVTLPYPEYAAIVRDPLLAACEQISELRGKGADVVVALTHLSWSSDREILGLDAQWKPMPASSRKCAQVPDIVIGGHDHRSMALPSGSPRLFKADADATSAWVIEIEKGAGGLRITPRLVELDQKRPRDPLVERIVDQWLRLHDERYCLRACVGVALISIVSEVFRSFERGVPVGGTVLSVPPGVQEIALAVILLGVLILRPAGLLGSHEVGVPGTKAAGRMPAEKQEA